MWLGDTYVITGSVIISVSRDLFDGNISRVFNLKGL